MPRRRLTGHDLVYAISVALLRGRVLVAPTHTVGPVRKATDEPLTLRFACIELNGTVKPGEEEIPLVVEDEHGRLDKDSTWQDDWSAYGAADKFVRLVTEPRARTALARLGAHPSFRKPSGEGPGRSAAGLVDPREGEGRRKVTATGAVRSAPHDVAATSDLRGDASASRANPALDERSA